MTYTTAKNCFKENIQLTGGADKDPVGYNLFNGLFQLTQQLSSDMDDIRRELNSLRRDVDNLQGSVRQLR